MPKSRILVTAVDSNGVSIYNERPFAAEVRVLTSPSPVFKVIELRLAVPAGEAETFNTGLLQGEVELLMEGVPSRVIR